MDTRLNDIQTIERWGIRFTGIVQGVGFRPLVSMLANQLELVGFVYNDGSGVYVEAQGAIETLQLLVDAIHQEQPRLCRITSCHIDILPVQNDMTFVIKESPIGNPIKTFISADTAPCEDCLQEMRDSGRREDYAFTNCTNCGPRYSIIEAMPYDRVRTTMNEFMMCDDCAAEYNDMDGRRYHAEPNACNICGPHYTMLDSKGQPIDCNDVFSYARQQIAAGAIIALKGVGGYHLVCDALQDKVVRTLRERKGRKDKPFAVMAGSIDIVEDFAYISNDEVDALLQMSRPIVLLNTKKTASIQISPFVAPNNHLIGVMLPYAPVHNVLIPEDAVWVMTSGNRTGDSVLFDDREAFDSLQGIADFFLVHNRRICAPVDDSLVSIAGSMPIMIRRSRGYVPEPIHCGQLGKHSILAMGSDLKNVFAMNKGTEVLLSPHIGDLASASTHNTLEWTVDRYQTLFAIKPEAIVVDSHLHFFSSAYGRKLSNEWQIPCIEVQHHHSHIGAVMAEYNLMNPVLGICFDGTGYGDDGTIWGGEFLLCHKGEYKRIGHLHLAPLPGGEKAVFEPWRQALWYVRQHYGTSLPTVYEQWLQQLPKGWEILDKALQSDMPIMMTSSGGRLFDAVGCLLGLGNVHTYDAQIAISLEAVCESEKGNLLEYNYDGTTLDLMPAVYQLMDNYVSGESVAHLAASFHRTLSIALCEVAADLCSRYGIEDVALGGGVLQNRRLLKNIQNNWYERNLYINRQVPCNDGGLALGQLWIAQHKLQDM